MKKIILLILLTLFVLSCFTIGMLILNDSIEYAQGVTITENSNLNEVAQTEDNIVLSDDVISNDTVYIDTLFITNGNFVYHIKCLVRYKYYNAKPKLLNKSIARNKVMKSFIGYLKYYMIYYTPVRSGIKNSGLFEIKQKLINKLNEVLNGIQVDSFDVYSIKPIDQF